MLDLVCKNLDEDYFRFVIVKNITTFQETLVKLTHVLLETKAILMEPSYGIFDLISYIFCLVSTGRIEKSLRIRRDFLILCAPD